MTFHMESMYRSVEYQQQRVAQDIEAARNSTFWPKVRVEAGALLIRIGEWLEHDAARVGTPATSPTGRPRPASA